MAEQKPSKAARDNRANQLNPNNDAYWRSRGEPARPSGKDRGKPEGSSGSGRKSRR